MNSKSFVVHVIDETQPVVKRAEIEATRGALRTLCAELGSGPKLVVFEAGNQMQWIADTLKRQPGVVVRVLHPNEVKWIAESGGKKTARATRRRLIARTTTPMPLVQHTRGVVTRVVTLRQTRHCRSRSGTRRFSDCAGLREMGREGLEPSTRCLKGTCSTT